MTFLGRDAIEVEALITDRYLESLLGGHAPTTDRPSRLALDEAIRFAARHMSQDLPRYHPSFRFEERLAHRLGELAVSLRLPAAAGAEGVLVPFGGYDPAMDLGDLRDLVEGDGDPRRLTRPLIIGGAITSAALSLVGVAWVAWRRSRPPVSAMARAVRAVNAARSRMD